MLRRPAMLFLAGALLAACSGGPVASTSTTAAKRPPLSATGPRTDAFSTSTVTFVDAARPVVSDGAVLAAERHLPTTIVTPVGTGSWPLVVAIHGYGVGPSTYQRYLDQLASHGFVVAAPSFPLEDPAQGFPLDRSHLDDEAGDVAFVIDRIEADPSTYHVEPNRIGVVGHSDGADVALLVGYDQTVHDPRVRAVVADAPDPIAAPVIDGGAPLLLVQGTDDEIVDPSSARTVFGQLSAERWLVELEGADHAGPIVGPSPWTASFDAATDAFLVATLVTGGTNGLTASLTAVADTEVSAAPGP